MAPRLRHRLTRLTVATVAALAVLVGLAAPAAAGGWAVGSLDEVPVAVPGGTADVGFTILQHGVTPVDLTTDVGIEVVQSDGTRSYFAAAPDGPAGHYIAAVTFPVTAGAHSWSIHMGWFGFQDLGTLPVTAGSAPDAVVAGASSTPWTVTRWVLLGLGGVLGIVAVADLAAGRRQASAARS